MLNKTKTYKEYVRECVRVCVYVSYQMTQLQGE